MKYLRSFGAVRLIEKLPYEWFDLFREWQFTRLPIGIVLKAEYFCQLMIWTSFFIQLKSLFKNYKSIIYSNIMLIKFEIYPNLPASPQCPYVWYKFSNSKAQPGWNPDPKTPAPLQTKVRKHFLDT